MVPLQEIFSVCGKANNEQNAKSIDKQEEDFIQRLE